MITNRGALLGLALATLVACGGDDGGVSIDGPPGADAAGTDGAATPGPDAPAAHGIDGAGPCSDGALNVIDPDSGHCYSLYLEVNNWADSLAACDAKGGHLATITTAEENALLANLIGISQAWIGGNDLDEEGVYIWITGEPFDYTTWAPGQPNDGGPGDEDCIDLSGFAGGNWDDFVCENVQEYLCEYE